MRKIDTSRFIYILALVLVITALHYFTNTQKVQFHDIYRRLYYVPIVLGGLWFSLRGGLGTSLLVSLLFAPHVVVQWGHHPSVEIEQYLEILLYNVIGFLTGGLSHREHQLRLRYQETADTLQESYSKLREQADLILEIEEQLRRADRLSALGELSAGMAHEIRNPLGSIRGTAEILQDAFDASDARHEFSRILIREVDRLNSVVQNFLNFAKPTEGDRGLVDPLRVLREVVELTNRQAVQSGVMTELRLQGAPGVAGDAGQLKQAFLNLVLNAFQAMPEGGRLTLESRVEAGRLLLEFRDTGKGIVPENLDRIFNPFFTTRPDGTGLGLAITHRIVQGHRGTLSVVSQSGLGTTFTLSFPLLKES